jgi:carboxyl-terminal processing protease
MRTFKTFTMTVALLTMAGSVAFAQYAPGSNCANGQCNAVQPGYGSAWSRSNNYNSANGNADVRYNSHSPAVRPAFGSGANDFPELPASWSTFSSRSNTSAVPVDSFSRPAGYSRPDSGYDNRDLNSQSGDQVRYRVPLDNVVPAANDRFDARYRDRFNQQPADPFRDNLNSGYDQYTPVDRYSPIDRYAPADLYSPSNGHDPFVPAQQPQGQLDDETTTINNTLTYRYQNPVTVRAIRAMSSNQAVQLFAEVSQKIDERSLEPTSYDLRVRRALRNLTLALDNQAFVNGLGISANSFSTDGFRNSLSRLASNGQVQNYQDARTVLNTVMQSAQSVQGLNASVVAYEFANASIDTLDKFSGLEPADPGSRNGAELTDVKSAALEENIVGVGVEVREHAEGLIVVKPLRGGPAAEAGMEAGDVILSLNGQTIGGMKMASSVDLMKGSSGSQLKMRVYREGKGERDFTLTRRSIRVWTVNDTKMLPGTDVGYFSLSRFSQNSTAEVDQALNELYSKGMKSLVLDLRGNPGGLLTTCVEISDRFLACGTIVTTKGRLSGDNMVERATYNKTWSVPLVVLVDGDSASASEIFAAAIQENRRGVVVGTRSYGKGSVQTHFPLSAIGGDLRLTTALFYSPNGRRMAGEGVTPDVEINDRDGVVNGDEVLVESVRIARSQTLVDMAKSSGTCKTAPSAGRSSSLSNMMDPGHSTTSIR